MKSFNKSFSRLQQQLLYRNIFRGDLSNSLLYFYRTLYKNHKKHRTDQELEIFSGAKYSADTTRYQ